MPSDTSPEASNDRLDGAEELAGHPALKYAATHNAPLGMIPRLEPQWSHKRIFDIVQPTQVMIKMPAARQLAKRGETASSYFHPDTDVITTTTTNDTQLYLTSRDHEWDILTDFQPDYHIPADHSVYDETEPEDRAQRLAKCIAGTKWVHEQITDNPGAFAYDPPTLLPLIKGVTEEEREPFYQLSQNINAPMSIFYAVQYFTAGQRIYDLLDDLQAIDENAPEELPLGLIGLLAPHRLEECPDRVVASAGQNAWFSDIAPRKDEPDEVVDEYLDTATAVHESLRTPAGYPYSLDSDLSP